MDLRSVAPLFITNVVDRSLWVRGEWDTEPDFVYWFDRDTWYRCLMVRHAEMGHLCGYVGVTKSHPAYYMHEAALESSLEVHGGVTAVRDESVVSDFGASLGAEYGIPSTIYPLGPEPTKWIGFDCAHSGDYIPAMAVHPRRPAQWPNSLNTTYRTMDYVRQQCARLAWQLYLIPGPAIEPPTSVAISLGDRRKIRIRRV